MWSSVTILTCFTLQSSNFVQERDISTGEETCMEVVVALNVNLSAFRECQLLIAELQNS